MKVFVKLLNQQQFTIDVNPEDTIESVKEKIEKEHGHSAHKIIFSGQILEDNKKVQDYSLKENDFLVLMVRKGKPAPSKSVEPPKETPKPNPTPTEPSKTSISETKPQETPAPTSNLSGIATGPEYESAVENLCAMGFEREAVVRAMRAAFNNPERAAEYLSEGYIPDFAETPQPQQQQQPQQPSQPQATGTQSTAFPNLFGSGPSTQSQSSGTFDALRQNPQFNAWRQMVQQNPQLLQHILQQLAQQNPQILQLINEHQNEFIQLLNEPSTGQPSTPGQTPEGGPTPPPGVQYIQVSEAEREAISRLESMGFERSKVIEAFFACEKDENLAANYLLENAGEDDDTDQTMSQLENLQNCFLF